MQASEIIAALRERGDAGNVAGMARYGITTDRALGVPIPVVRALAKKAGRDTAIAGELWASGIHEARILATLLADPKEITRARMTAWAREFDSWDVCDQACQNLFRYSPHAWEMAAKWAKARQEFVRRAGFSMMAGLAVKDKRAVDGQFEALLPLIRAAATDDRNMVKKAVNWALRSIGKRNENLRRAAIAEAERIQLIDSRAARWIASDALRELRTRG